MPFLRSNSTFPHPDNILQDASQIMRYIALRLNTRQLYRLA